MVYDLYLYLKMRYKDSLFPIMTQVFSQKNTISNAK
jgi:hypothetical protein